MYCKDCGKEIPDDSNVCPYCSEVLEIEDEREEKTKKRNKDSKSGVGAALGFFLSLVGLIIGYAIYPPESESRKTFKKGWLYGFLINLLLGILIGVIRACTI